MFKITNAFIFILIFYGKWKIPLILFQIILLLYKLSCLSYIRINDECFFKYLLHNIFSLPLIKNKDKLEVVIRKSNQKIIKKIQNKYIKNIFLNNEEIDKIERVYCENMEYSGYTFANLNGCCVKNLYCDGLRLKKINEKFLPYSLRKLVMIDCGLENFELSLDTLEELNISNNTLEVVKIRGANLKSLFCANNKIVVCELKCNNLKICDLSNNKLESIDVNDKLEKLSIINNHFVVLPVKLIKIRKLYLDGNPIIPNLNEYVWMDFFEKNYIHFFENNLEINVDNVYEDKELVHNSHVNYSIKKCIKELLNIKIEKFDMNKVKLDNDMRIEIEKLGELELNFLGIEGKIMQIFNAIFYLGKKNNCLENIIPILNEELKEGKKYCLMGQIGRIVTSIMGFGLIKNVVSVSQNEEIIMRYNIIKNRLKKDYQEDSDEYLKKLRDELGDDLRRCGFDENKINEWITCGDD